jgi:uncharacterized protein YpuA (DUF1002 family)
VIVAHKKLILVMSVKVIKLLKLQRILKEIKKKMKYYPNPERINEIVDLLSKENNKSKLEYLVYTYLTEYYQIGINEDGLQRIVNSILKSGKTASDIDTILISEINQALQKK